MSTKAQLATVITLDSTNFSKGLQNAISSLNQFSAQNRKVVAQSTGSYRKLADGLNGLVVKGFKVGVKAVTAFGAAIAALKVVTLSWNVAVLKASSKVAAAFEVLQVAFTSLTGSTEEARRVLAKLEAQSLKTGISVERQSSAVQKFLALGFDPQRALRLNEAILDVAGSVGLTAFQADQLGFALAQVANKGVVQMEELRQQIAEKGVPVFQALEEKTGLFGENLFKALKQNKIPAETLLEIFENLEGRFEKFRGGSERLGKTLFGTVNRIKAAIVVLQRIIGEQFNVQLTEFFTKIFDFLVGIKDEAEKLGKTFGKLGLAINKISDTFINAFKEGKLKEKVLDVLSFAAKALALNLKIAILNAFEFAFKDIGKYIAKAGRQLLEWSDPIAKSVAGGMQEGISIATEFFNTKVLKEMGLTLVQSFLSAAEILKGFGDIIRSTWDPATNEFIAKLQTVLVMLPDAANEFGAKITEAVDNIGRSIKISILSAVEVIANAFAKPFEILEEKIRHSPLLKMLKISPGEGFVTPNLFEIIRDELQEGLTSEKDEFQDRKQLAELRADAFDEKLRATLSDFLEQGSAEKLRKSGEESIRLGITDLAGSLTNLGLEMLKAPLNGIEDAQYKSSQRLQDVYIALKSMLGIMNLDLPVQKEILSQLKPGQTKEQKQEAERANWLEEKLGPRSEFANQFSKLDNFFGERVQERLAREAAGVSRKEFEAMGPLQKDLYKGVGAGLSGVPIPESSGIKELDAQAKSAADTIKDSTQQSAEAYKKGADAVQNESARLANSLANTAINSKAFWDAQMGVSEAFTTTPQQSQAFFTSFENWIKNRVANSRSYAGMAPDKMTQQFIDEGLTLAVRKHFMPIYKKELGIEDPREVKEMAVEDKRTAFWNSIKQMQGTLVENTSNMNNLNDRYGKQSYDAQREANRLAKQNQSELAGINQRLGGLGLIAA